MPPRVPGLGKAMDHQNERTGALLHEVDPTPGDVHQPVAPVLRGGTRRSRRVHLRTGFAHALKRDRPLAQPPSNALATSRQPDRLRACRSSWEALMTNGYCDEERRRVPAAHGAARRRGRSLRQLPSGYPPRCQTSGCQGSSRGGGSCARHPSAGGSRPANSGDPSRVPSPATARSAACSSATAVRP